MDGLFNNKKKLKNYVNQNYSNISAKNRETLFKMIDECEIKNKEQIDEKIQNINNFNNAVDATLGLVEGVMGRKIFETMVW